MAIASKEQERKALEQIRKIIEGLGEGSYVGTAFEGCFEDAESNIAMDAAYSWKARFEVQTKGLQEECDKSHREITRLRADIAGLKAENKDLNESRAKYEGWAEKRGEKIQELNKRLEEANKDLVNMYDRCFAQATKLEELEQEIIKLKAKLYDLTVEK